MSGIALKSFNVACVLVSVVFSVVFFNNCSQKADIDSNIYPVTFCDLSENSKKYDGKLVRVKAIHGGLGIDTPTFLAVDECDEQIWVTCKMDGDSCVKMYDQLRSIGGVKDPGALPQIDAVGRFKADSKLPQMLSPSETKRGKLFEITELKGIETIRK